MKWYSDKRWKAYCAEQIALHSGVCSDCLRSGNEVVLQVHHINYVKGRMPWDYPYDECEVLCRGCHAKEHGIIMPSKDWVLIGEDDLGGLDGDCEKCHQKLRYAHMITHPNWGTMTVGAQCCDKLTELTIGSESHVEFLNYINRRKTFIDSSNWNTSIDRKMLIQRAGIKVQIESTEIGNFHVCLNGVKGNIKHATPLEAKIFAFDFIESGGAVKYLAERQRKIAERSRRHH